MKSVAGILFKNNAILLIRRRDVPVWVLPGGGVEAGETEEEALMREMLEETGFAIHIERPIATYHPQNRLARPTRLYQCAISTGALATTTSETRDARFFPIDRLPPMPPPYPEWIADTLDRLPPFHAPIASVTYAALLKHLLLHPILVVRFLLARFGHPINSRC